MVGTSASEPVRFILYPPNPPRGAFVIFRAVPCDPDSVYEVRVNKNSVFPASETLPSGCVGYLAVPSGASTRAVLELRRNNITVATRVLTFPPLGKGIESISVSKGFVNPAPWQAKRAEIELKHFRRIRTDWTNVRLFGNSPVFPVLNGRLGTRFGENRNFNGERDSVHWGTDIAGAPASIRAVFPGRVIFAQEMYYAGKTVLIQHGCGLMTQYSHLSNFNVKVGDYVPSGGCLGRMGMTGRATGPHLHLGAYVKGIPVDPMSVISNCARYRFY